MNNLQGEICNYRVDKPYTPIKVRAANSNYACEMLSNMADVVSEMSDVVRYFYISVVTKPYNSYMSSCFHHISIVEMHHLDIFAQFAQLLGADPRLWNCRDCSCWWSPSFIGYPREIKGLLEESINAETAAIQKYSRQARMVCDQNIVDMLNRIILDETRHRQIFREMYQQI